MYSKKSIKTNLFKSKSPLEWAVSANNTIYTTQIPIDENGNIVTGGIKPQVKKTFENLVDTLKCAGVTTDEVLQVLIYVTDIEYISVVNDMYTDYFNNPYPNRAAVVVSSLARDDMFVEFIVYATATKKIKG